MKRKTAILLGFIFILLAPLFATHNSEFTGEGEIVLEMKVSDQKIPGKAKEVLLDKIRQFCTINNLSVSGTNPFFVIDTEIEVLSKDLQKSPSLVHNLNLKVVFLLKNMTDNTVCSKQSVEVKGTGKNETQAYINAFNNIDTSAKYFGLFIESSKRKIIEFYNSNCDFIISNAEQLSKQGKKVESDKIVKSVPKACPVCYSKSRKLLDGTNTK